MRTATDLESQGDCEEAGIAMDEIRLRAEQVYRELHGIPENRCVLCGWTLAGSVSDGCVPGNCAYRPGGSEEGSARSRIRAHIETIEAALRAERERAAKIADEHEDPETGGLACGCGVEIARIRGEQA